MRKDKILPMTKSDQQRLTQHKRFVPYGTHPNPALLRLGIEVSRSSIKISQELFNWVAEMTKKCWASFMLEPLYEMAVKAII